MYSNEISFTNTIEDNSDVKPEDLTGGGVGFDPDDTYAERYSRGEQKAGMVLWWQVGKPRSSQDFNHDQPDHGTQTTKNPFYNNVIRSRSDSGDQQHPNSDKQNSDLVKKMFTLNKSAVKKIRRNSGQTDLMLDSMCIYFYDTAAFRNNLKLRSEAYMWMVVLMGIFYTLPVFQMALFNQKYSVSSGNLDICRFNFECMRPWVGIQDFGHVFSNISYVICGAIFLCIVVHRRNRRQALVSAGSAARDPMHLDNCGIPEQFGIFYAMGTSLIMEGILSTCYHICPNAVSFQFDTTFMYAIGVLVFLKVYQFRHPDITQTAHVVFFVFGLVLSLEVVGYFTNHLAFWIIFMVFHIIITGIVIAYIHTNGCMQDMCINQIRSALRNIFTCEFFDWRAGLKRGAPEIFASLINIGLAIYFYRNQKPGVSRYLLIIIMANMLMYVCYYILRKLHFRFRCRNWFPTEGIHLLTILYGILTIAFAGVGGYFFLGELRSITQSAAVSKNLNGACFLGMYDNHDMWHFSSSLSILASFMFLLTLEDGNTRVPRHRIPVF